MMKSSIFGNYTRRIILPLIIAAMLFGGGMLISGVFGGISVCLIGMLVVRCICSMCADFKPRKSADDIGVGADTAARNDAADTPDAESGEYKAPADLQVGLARNNKLGDYAIILFYVLAVRLAVYVIAYVAAKTSGAASGSIFESFYRIWAGMGTDAPHYLGIAERWYTTVGDPMYHIVFFPLFPTLTGTLNLFFGETILSAAVLNILLSFGIGIAGYELALLDFDRHDALRFIRYVFIIPGAFFYAAPMTESLFVLLCISCIYAARKDSFLLAGIIGALAALTRMQGILLALPCGYIALRTYIQNRDRKGEVRTFLVKCAKLCIMLAGTGIYLYINYSLWGTPFKFMEFQKEHWQQSLGFFGDTVQMIADYFRDTYGKIAEFSVFRDVNAKYAFALWLPQLLYVILSPLPLIYVTHHVRNRKKAAIDTSYTVFFVIYYVISCGATWLLSAPRYLMACIPLPLALSLIGRKRALDIALTVVCLAAGGIYLYMYSAGVGFIY